MKLARLCVLTVLLGGAAAVAGGKPPADRVVQPHTTVALLADHAAVASGQRFRIGVQFTLDPRWHIYWVTAGEPDAPAMPTNVSVQAPPGFVVSRPLFPPPREFDAGVEGKLYIIEGKPVVLFDVQAPEKLGGASATFQVSADWLVCEKSCVRGKAELALTLPVVDMVAKAAAANEAVFASASRALPVAQEKAKYVTLTGVSGAARIETAAKFEAELIIEVQAGHHIQSHKPRDKSLIATQVFVEPTEGVEIGKPNFPRGTDREVPGLGKVSEYHGRVRVGIPVEVIGGIKAGAALHGVVIYQACTDKGACFPPQTVAFAIELAGHGGPTVASAPAKAGEDAAAAVRPAAPAAPGVAEAASNAELPWLERTQRWFAQLGLAGYLVMALLGGFLLNFMPCVLPVISLKVLSFVKQAQESRLKVAGLGLTFAAGILVSYLVLAYLAFAADRTWGGLFQIPQVSIGLAAVVTAFSLSLFGVFTLSPPQAVNALGEKVSGEGFGSALGMGMLATLLGTACTAPFLSAVIAIAVKQPRSIGVLIFAAAGMGMAMPYIVLTLNPRWLRFVPRAGPWMKTFEQVMGFVLLGTVLWVLYPLPNQITGKGVIAALGFMLAVSFAAWLYGRVEFGAPAGKKLRYYAGAAAFIVGGWWLPFRQINTIESLQAEAVALRMGGGAVVENWEKAIPWRPYRRSEALASVAAGYTVFVDYTADWCASCKANEASSLNIDATRRLMAELKVRPYRADYTSESPEIKADLDRLGRAGVPVYVIYPPRQADKPIILPELLTPGLVRDGLRQAGASRPDQASTSGLAENTRM